MSDTVKKARYKLLTDMYNIPEENARQTAKLNEKQFGKFIKLIEYDKIDFINAYRICKSSSTNYRKKNHRNNFRDFGRQVDCIEI